MDDYLAANRANWNDRVPVHASSSFYDIERWLADSHGPRPCEVESLGDVAGQRLVHLQCHLGLDTLAFARAGAHVTGLDFSGAALGVARSMAARTGLDDRARFVEADVLDAANALAPQVFDIVYVSIGSLCWLPSVERWAAQVAGLLGSGGRLYLHDDHPLSWALADDGAHLEHSYFEEVVPETNDGETTYTDGDSRPSHSRSYEWNHSLGEIVSALIHNGLVIDALTEHDWTLWPRFPWLVERDGEWHVPADRPRLPLSFTLLASRPSR